MKIKTKNYLAESTILGMVEKHFPNQKVTSIHELSGGLFNAVYLVAGEGILKDGIILKAGSTSDADILTCEKDILYTEVTILESLQNKNIVIPRVLASDFSRNEIDGDYYFMTKLHGESWKETKDISPENLPHLMNELGKCTAVIHSTTGDRFGYMKRDVRFQFDSWNEAFASMVNDILEDGRRHIIELPYQEIQEIVANHNAILNEVKTPRLVDFDLWAANVLLKPSKNGYELSGIIDFERAYFGDPLADFVTAMMLYDDVEKQPEFCEGYSKAGMPSIAFTESDRKRMNLYRLYKNIILCVETYRYNRAPEMIIQMRGYFQQQIGALIAEIHTKMA